MTQDYIEFLRPWKKVRMFGSAALSCAYVSSGKCMITTMKRVFFMGFRSWNYFSKGGGQLLFNLLKIDEK